jgi:hypothetical protein
VLATRARPHGDANAVRLSTCTIILFPRAAIRAHLRSLRSSASTAARQDQVRQDRADFRSRYGCGIDPQLICPKRLARGRGKVLGDALGYVATFMLGRYRAGPRSSKKGTDATRRRGGGRRADGELLMCVPLLWQPRANCRLMCQTRSSQARDGNTSGIGGKAECARRVLKTSLMTRPDPAWWQQTKFRGRFC